MTHIRKGTKNKKGDSNMKDKNNKAYVPYIHPGCSLAETGRGEYDDFDNPLRALDIIPEGKEISFVRTEKTYRFDGEDYVDIKFALPPEMKNPSSIRKEPLIAVIITPGVHPITFLKEKGVNIENAWIFMHEEVVETLRKLPYRYHQKTVAYGEFFRFEDFDTISLQTVQYLPNWRVVLNGQINGKEFSRPSTPECIIELVIEK